MSSVGKRDVRCPHRLAFVAQPGVAQRLSHRGSVSQFRQNATATHRKQVVPAGEREVGDDRNGVGRQGGQGWVRSRAVDVAAAPRGVALALEPASMGG
jgi:hypothetical protein